MRPAVILDRDGTLIEEVHYLRSVDQVRLLPGVPQALRALRDAGFALVLITNQSGVARGFVTEAALQDIHAALARSLGVDLDGLYCCPHHPDEGCACRKPATALLEQARADLGLDLGRSWAVGDKVSDLEGALRLGCRAILVRTGHGSAQDLAGLEAAVEDDFPAAARRILEETPA